MQESDPSRVHFGPFELDLGEGVLRKYGVRIKLQEQLLQILTALLENPGSVVTRDDLRRRLWPDDSFGDFEHRLNAAVTRLRQALSDSADRPRYIETMAKRGYRFIGEVKIAGVESPQSPPVVRSPTDSPVIGRREQKRSLAVGIGVAAVLVAAGFSLTLLTARKPAPAWRFSPFTTFPGQETNPAISPDGESVAFTWNGERQDNFDIYVMSIGSTIPVRFTTDASHDLSPAWSPDGRTIAFLRRLGNDRAELFLVPSSGGPEHKIGETRNADLHSPPLGLRVTSISWSTDGRWVAASHREPADSSDRIYLFSLTGEKRRLTSPSAGDRGDYMPAFSRNGRMLAFCRLSGFSTSEIFVQSLQPDFSPDGEARRLTHHKRWSVNPAWTGRGSTILYLFTEVPATARRRELRMADASRNRGSWETIDLNDHIHQISVGRHLAYTQVTANSSVWRARIPAAGEPPAVPERFLHSTRSDSGPRYSPDGRKISFFSTRSGTPEFWIAKPDGSDPTRVTSFRGPSVNYPAWSPDGQWLVFHSRLEGQADLFVMPVAGGSPKRLTSHPGDEIDPLFSEDGRWIYYSSFRSGRWQIWKMRATGGEESQITYAGGLKPIESPDGKTIYFISETKRAIWKVPSAGGPESEVLAEIHPTMLGFQVTRQGIYYIAPPYSGDDCYLRFRSFSTGRDRAVVLVRGSPFSTVISVEPAERYLLFHQTDRPGMDLMLVDNFQM